VEIFKTLKKHQIGKLVDEMVDAPFEKGEFVFEQGDEGSEFYVIITGSAEVLHDDDLDDPDNPEVQLAVYHDFDIFGERALLRHEPRFASVKATSKLSTMCLTSAGCERALGKPLKECVPDVFQK